MSKTRTFIMVLVIATACLAITGGRASAAGQGPNRCASIRVHSGTLSLGDGPTLLADCPSAPGARPIVRYPYMQK